MPRIMLIGDVGGCPAELARAIEPVLDDPGTLVIQVGDLVDRGPDSPGVLDLVGQRLAAAPDRWIQLIGNHESQYLGGEAFWPDQLDPDSADLLRRWWLTDRVRVAAALRTAEGAEFLVSHAGLTVEAWRELDGPVTAGTAADLLNTRPAELLWSYGGPLWVEAADLYESWLRGGEPVPFGQIHGHATIVDFGRRAWRCSERVRQRSTVDWSARQTVTRVSTSRFLGIDPKHGRHGAPSWAPLIFEDATLLA